MKQFFRLSSFIVLAICLVASCATSTLGETSPGNQVVYPMETDVTLTYWLSMNWNVSANYASFGDTPFAQNWMEATGVKLEFIHSATDDSFSLMMVSNDMPDLIEYWWDAYPGGPQAAVSDNKIVTLNQVWDELPLFSQWMAEHPDIDGMVKYDNGDYIGFPSVNGDGETIPISYGLMIRQDYLDAVGMAVPDTIDEWHDVLTAFKNELGLESPLTGTSINVFARAFNMRLESNGDSWYVDGDTVKYGRFESNYRDVLIMWKQWYDEGLLDRDILNIETDLARAKILDGTAGAISGYWSTLALLNGTGPNSNPDFNIVAAPLPTLGKDDVNNAYGYAENPYESSGVRVMISSQCAYPEIAARLMDYLWGEEGHNLAMWGIEGETYTVDENGNKNFTDFVLYHPSGWTAQQVRAACMRVTPGPFYQEFVNPQTFTFEQQFDSLEIWGNNATLEHLLPPILRTAQEDVEFSRIMTDITTHVEESEAQFILGMRSLDEFDRYIEELKSMRIERAIEIQQDALNRYLAK